MKKSLSFYFLSFILLFNNASAQYEIDRALISDTAIVKELIAQIKENINEGKYDVAFNSAFDAFSMADKINYLKGKADVYHMLGIIYYKKSNYSKAREKYNSALEIRRMIGDESGMAASLNTLGNIYLKKEIYKQALLYYDSSLQIRVRLNEKKGAAMSYNNIGEVYRAQRNYDDAMDNAIRALGIRQEINDQQGIADSYGNIGIIYAEQEKWDMSLNYNLMALHIENEINDKHGIIVTTKTIGHIYLDLNKFSQAEEYLSGAVEQAEQFEHKDEMLECYELFAKLYKKTNAFEKASEAYEKYIQLKNSLARMEEDSNLAFAEGSNKFDKQLAEALAKAEMKATLANIYLIGFALMAVFAVIFLLQRNRLSKQKKESEKLILNILPEETAKELKAKGHVKPKRYEMATVMFIDFVKFTEVTEKMKAEEVVNELNTCFSKFDNIITKHHLEKIKTLGDGYMCAGGLPVENNTNAEDAVKAALEIQDYLSHRREDRIKHRKLFFEARIGIHTGPVVAGIVGNKKYSYDIWGNTVNIASRMEFSGESGKINVSNTTYELVKNKFNTSQRGSVESKNNGAFDMHFINAGSLTTLSEKRKQAFILQKGAESIKNIEQSSVKKDVG
jgi:adenylate cyclase